MRTYHIQANEKGSRFIVLSDSHLHTIDRYNLLSELLNSTGFVDQKTLDKLQLNVRSLLEHTDKNMDLLNLCQDILFHDDMKAYGLFKLIEIYLQWKQQSIEQPLEI